MSYTIKLTNGKTLTTVRDGTVDDISSDIKLIGRSVTGFGEILNDNLIQMLENFASESPPSKPLKGQLWFNSADSNIQVYTISGWRSASGPIVSDTEPFTLSTGDLWIDSRQNQLYFYDGIDLQLAGPIYGKSHGISGFRVDTVFDANGNSYTIASLYIAGQVYAILSGSSFTPSPTIEGFTSINRGFQISSLFADSFYSTVENALQLNGLTSDEFMRLDIDQSTTGKLYVLNDSGITVGTNNVGTLYRPASTTAVAILNNVVSGNIKLQITNESNTTIDVIHVSGSSKVGILNNTPTTELDVSGRIKGTNLTVVTAATLGNITVSNNTISGTDNLGISVPAGKNILLTNSPKITGLADPVSNNDAANKIYVDDSTKLIPLSFTFVDNGMSLDINANIILMLNDIAPPINYKPTKSALVHAQSIDFINSSVNRYLKKFVINLSNRWVFDADLTGTTPNTVAPPS